MKRIFVLSTALLLCIVSGYAAPRTRQITGSGKIRTDIRQVEPYTGLKVSRGIEATIVEGNPGELHIEADEKIYPYLSISVEEGTLHIAIDNEIRSIRNCKIAVTVPCPEQPSALTASSGAKIYCRTVLDTRILDVRASSGAEVEVAVRCSGCMLDASSGAEIKANIAAQRCAIEASSGAKIGISGESSECRIDVSSGASCKGRNLLVETADIEASSAASAHISCRKQLRAQASSGAKIVYWGNCDSTYFEKSSNGTITNRK